MGFPGARAKATLGRTIDIRIINQVIDLLKDYGVVHIDLFTSLFNRKHGQILDASSLGFDDGLRGFFREISDIITLFEDGNIELNFDEYLTKGIHSTQATHITMKQPVQRILDRINKRREKNLFNPRETLLWSNDYQYLLEIDLCRITIDKSPLELNLLSRKILPTEVTAIHKILVNHTNGIKLNELRQYYQFNLRSFSSPSLDTLTVEYPELFYRVEPERDGDEPLIYDGKTKTIDDLSGKSVSNWGIDPAKLCSLFVLSGLYQKTLILIKKAGTEGLKLAVWQSTVKINLSIFGHSSRLDLETKLLDKEPLELFLALASEGFVLIKSHKNSKNDLRIFFPSSALDFNRYFQTARKSSEDVSICSG